MALSNGNKITAAILTSGALATVTSVAGLATGQPHIAEISIAGFFSFLGGLVMGKIL